MFRDKLDEALIFEATETLICRNGWWKVSFANYNAARLFQEYAIEKGWIIIGSNLTFGVRPTL
jgi:hypothetical protein